MHPCKTIYLSPSLSPFLLLLIYDNVKTKARKSWTKQPNEANEDEGKADRLSHQQREQQQQQQYNEDDDDDDDAGDDAKVQAQATRHRVNFEISPLSCAIHVRGVAKGAWRAFSLLWLPSKEEGGGVVGGKLCTSIYKVRIKF